MQPKGCINEIIKSKNMIATKKTVFSEDIANKQMKVTREFDAPIEKVWKAWTESELLDKWWAPRPWKAMTKSMDFRTNGSWLYCMVGPEGEKHWATIRYSSIDPLKNFTGIDAFCDENGKINEELPSMQWSNNFSEKDGITTVVVDITFPSVEALKKITEMGFKEGFSMAHANLDEILAA